MKKVITVIAIVIGVVVALSVVKDNIIKISAEKGVEMATGLPLKIRGMRVGILRTLVGIKGLTVYNPKGFSEKVMLDMPEIYVDYNLPDIIKGNIHLEEMRLNLREFIVVKNKNGEVNLNSLKVVKAQEKGKASQKKEQKESPKIQIDDFHLRVDKVIYKDYSKGGEPVVKEFKMNIDERYKDIKDAYTLISLLVVASLRDTAIANLTNIDLRGLQSNISGTLATAKEVAVQAAAEAKEAAAKAALEAKETAAKAAEEAKKTAADAASKATDTVKEAAKSAEDLIGNIKLPFGKE